MSSKLRWYYGRCSAWISAIVAAGSLTDPVKTAINVDLSTIPQTEEEVAERLAVMVSWLESLESVVPPEEKARIKKLLSDIDNMHKEMLT